MEWLKVAEVAGRPAFCDFGEPVTRGSIVHLKRVSGLKLQELSRELEHVAQNGFKYALQNSVFGPRCANRRIRPDAGERIVQWRDHTIRQLARSKPGRKAYNMAAILKRFLPELPHAFKLLVSVLEKTQEFLIQHPNSNIEQWQDWLCQEAKDETRGRSNGDAFRKFLRWAPELSSTVAGNLERIRSQGRLKALALEILVSRWRSASAIRRTAPTVSATLIEEALRRRTKRISPDKMVWLIRALAPPGPGMSQGAQPASERVKQEANVGGAPKGQRPVTKLRNEMAALSELLGWSQKQVAADLMPGKEVATEQMNSTFDYFSHHRAEIEDQKSCLRGISPENLNERYMVRRLELSETLSRKHGHRGSRLA